MLFRSGHRGEHGGDRVPHLSRGRVLEEVRGYLWRESLKKPPHHLLITDDPGRVQGVGDDGFLPPFVDLHSFGGGSVRAIKEPGDLRSTEGREHKGLPEQVVRAGELLGGRRAKGGSKHGR